MIEITNILDAENYLDGIKAVVFDLDDTLYSEKDYVKSGYKKIADFFGRPEFATQMWDVFTSGGKAIDEVLKAENLFQFKDEALKIYRCQIPDIKIYPGVDEMLQHIYQSGKKIGIITDGRPEGQRAKLKALNVSVENIIITDELGGIEFRKPNATAFYLMRDMLNVPFEQMVYIGDNIQKDFIAPEKLGIRSIWFRNIDGLYSKSFVK